MSYIHDVYSQIAGDDTLQYINYENLRQEDKEFLRDDIWHFEFTTSPKAVYFPKTDVISARLKTVSFTFNDSITQLEGTVRQHKLTQSAFSGDTGGSLTLEFLDREDQAISLMHEDWKDKIGSRKTRFTYRKKDLMGTCKYILFNSSRTPIRVYEFKGVQLNNVPKSPTTTSDAPSTSNSEISLELVFENYTVDYKLGGDINLGY